MAKRRLRRTDPNSRDSGLGDVVGQMRRMSAGVVESAMEATRAALEGMREMGRRASEMVVPATRKSTKRAKSAKRTTKRRAA